MISDDITKKIAEDYANLQNANALLENLLQKPLTDEQIDQLIESIEKNEQLNETVRQKVVAGLKAAKRYALTASLLVSPHMGTKTTTTPGTPGTPDKTVQVTHVEKGKPTPAPEIEVNQMQTDRGFAPLRVKADDPRVKMGSEKGGEEVKPGDVLPQRPGSYNDSVIQAWQKANAESMKDKVTTSTQVVKGTPGTPATVKHTPTLGVGSNRAEYPQGGQASQVQDVNVGQRPPRNPKRGAAKPTRGSTSRQFSNTLRDTGLTRSNATNPLKGWRGWSGVTLSSPSPTPEQKPQPFNLSIPQVGTRQIQRRLALRGKGQKRRIRDVEAAASGIHDHVQNDKLKAILERLATKK
jgi:hypothetical protein